MDERILEFIGDLRRAEVRVSPSEALDALAASSEIGLADRDAFKAALGPTPVKEGRGGGGRGGGRPRRSAAQSPGLDRLMYFLQVGFFSRRISDRFDWSAVEADLERILKLLEARGLDPGQLARIRNYLELRLEAFKRMIRQHVERELERRAYRQGEKLTLEALSDKPLFGPPADEIAAMKNIVARRHAN